MCVCVCVCVYVCVCVCLHVFACHALICSQDIKCDIVIISMPQRRRRGGMAVSEDYLSNLRCAGKQIAECCQSGPFKDDRVFLAISGEILKAHAVPYAPK